MVGYWVGFAIFLLLMIMGTFGLKMPWSLRIRYWLFAGIMDAFYISIVYSNLACQFIFGGLDLIIVFTNLSINFVQSNKQILLKRIELVLDLLVGVGVTIYLIYIIPNESLKEVVIPVVAAVYGGLLTLVGVALTIKNTQKDNHNNEIKKARPLVFICDQHSYSSQRQDFLIRFLSSENCRGTLKSAKENEQSYVIPQILIENSDYSYAYLIGFKVNSDYHIYDYGQVLAKKENLNLQSKFKFKYKGKIKYLALILQDLLDNIYEFEVKFEICGNENEKTIKILSGIETKKSDLPINPKEI